MSRGLGKVERLVLDYLAERRPDSAVRLDVLAHATGCHPESARRAIRSLARKGMVEIGRDSGWRDFGGEITRFWETTVPTARLCADNSPTLTGESA